MPLHSTLEALPDRHRRYVHILPRHEMRRIELCADGNDSIRRHLELGQAVFGWHSSRDEMTEQGGLCSVDGSVGGADLKIVIQGLVWLGTSMPHHLTRVELYVSAQGIARPKDGPTWRIVTGHLRPFVSYMEDMPRFRATSPVRLVKGDHCVEPSTGSATGPELDGVAVDKGAEVGVGRGSLEEDATGSGSAWAAAAAAGRWNGSRGLRARMMDAMMCCYVLLRRWTA